MPDDTPDDGNQTEPDAALIEEAHELVNDLWSGQLLRATVDLGVFELLDDEPTPAAVIADELDLHPDRSYRVLRVLATEGVLIEDEQRRFSVTELGECFQRDHPTSVLPVLMFLHSREYVSSMLHLSDIMREGGPDGFVREFGREIFDYIDEHEEFGRRFNRFMTFASQQQTDQVIAALDSRDLTGISTICDIGGGHGHLLAHLLAEYPHLDGTVLELPSVIDEADEHWAPKLGVDDRCTYVAGDMFDSVPAAEAYLMKWILHDWDDDDCVEILSTIHEAAPPDGRLFIAEAVIRGPDQSDHAKQLDMPMMVLMGGRERTLSEYERLLERAGWKLTEQWVPDAGPMNVLEARKT